MGLGGVTSEPPSYIQDHEKLEVIRLVPGDRAQFKGLMGFPPCNKDESEHAYYQRIRPSATELVLSNPALSSCDIDAYGFGDALNGHIYDFNYSLDLRKAVSAAATNLEVITPKPPTHPNGTHAFDRRFIELLFPYKKRKSETVKSVVRETYKSVLKKIDVASGASKTGRQTHSVVRVFATFEDMQNQLRDGLRDPQRNPDFSGKSRGVLGHSIQDIRKHAPKTITHKQAKDILQGGENIQVGDKVILANGARRDVYEKALDEKGQLFWALMDTQAVASHTACTNYEKGKTDECDFEDLKHDIILNAMQDQLDFLMVEPQPPVPHAFVYPLTSVYSHEQVLNPLTKQHLHWTDNQRFEIQVLEDVILLPDYASGLVPFSEQDNQQYAPNVSESLNIKTVISDIVDAMAEGSGLDNIGFNVRVLKNMVAFRVASVSDISGESVELRARLLRLLVACFMYSIVFLTIARQASDAGLRSVSERNRLIDLSIKRSFDVDVSDLFPERKQVKTALQSKLTLSSINSMYEEELRESNLLREMLTLDASDTYNLSQSGYSIRSWSGFRPNLAAAPEPVFAELRSQVRQSLVKFKKRTGTSRRGRCCEQNAPAEADNKDEVRRTSLDTITGALAGSGLHMTIEALEKAEQYASPGVVQDIRMAMNRSLQDLIRELKSISEEEQIQKRSTLNIVKKALVTDLTNIYNVFRASKTQTYNVEDVIKEFVNVIKSKSIIQQLDTLCSEGVKLASYVTSIVVNNLETARESRKRMQVAYVESLDGDARNAYFAQRDIGIKLDEVMDFSDSGVGG